ncbi:MAG: hypothetical protein LBH28_01875, partial [Oscillospiraceae bacterium]|nr:hypothetical protein [Oscillospiraceae bacterium]
KIKEHNELYLDIGFSLLAIVMVDLSYLPVSMLGLEGGMSALSMLGINDAKVDQKGDTYTISYKNGEDERLVQICEYDASSDSVRSTISMEGSSSSDLVMEYVSSGDGYACQYFSRMDNGEYDLITMFFSANGDVAIGMSTVSKEPGSIYKNTGLKADFVLNDESYFLLEGGKLTVFSDGEKKTY